MEMDEKENKDSLEDANNEEEPACKELAYFDEERSEASKRLIHREFNTIPEKIELEITFHSKGFKIDKYPFVDKKNNIQQKEAAITIATIKYKRESAHLIMGRPFKLALTGNAIIGLANEIKSRGRDFNLQNRTFKVYNRNRKTYEWTEITKT